MSDEPLDIWQHESDREIDRLRAELAEQYTRHVVVVMSRDKAEAAIAGVRERCDYLAGHIAEIILRALDGGTE